MAERTRLTIERRHAPFDDDEQAATVTPEVAAHRLAHCLGPPTPCAFAHANPNGTHRCTAACCVAVARNLESAVRRRRSACGRRVDPLW